MPRVRRQKTFDGIYHIMCKSIKEVDLFQDKQDKLKYLELIKKYQKTYEFLVYGYCLMDNHCHIIIAANGADISKIMHDINFSYAIYFNKRHNRIGHLFFDRFKSKIVKNVRYLFTLSAYVHNNPMAMAEFKVCPENYQFSSLAVYLGKKSDPYEILDEGFILSMFGRNPIEARKVYKRLVFNCSGRAIDEDIEFENEGTEYKSCKKLIVRNLEPDEVINFIVQNMNVEKVKLHIKNSKNTVEAKAILVLLMKSFCNFTCREICEVLGNITQGRVSSLASFALKLIDEEKSYRILIQKFISNYAI